MESVNTTVKANIGGGIIEVTIISKNPIIEEIILKINTMTLDEARKYGEIHNYKIIERHI